jgi:hypothetical protein
MVPRCSECVLFRHENTMALDVGTCHRYPPTVLIVPAPNGAAMPATTYPQVKPEWWCGEFQPRLREV